MLHASAPRASAPQTCPGTAGNGVDEIFGTIQPLRRSAAANLRFGTSHRPRLRRPYVPMTSVSLQNLQHQFILPIGQLFAPWGAGGSGAVLGPLTATMPGEDLNVEPADDAHPRNLWGVQ